MSEPINQSEVARLRQKYAEEFEAAQRGLSGYAVVSRHQFVTKKMENMGRCHAQLAKLIGEREATLMVSEAIKDL
jgi:hypothetical protein